MLSIPFISERRRMCLMVFTLSDIFPQKNIRGKKMISSALSSFRQAYQY